MKAFLSHSSKDKGFVESVASLLRPGSYELDSQTFDAGSINSQAIIAALKRSDLFCLFLSKDSTTSAYVDFETLLGLEFIAGGKISQFLALCLDNEAFDRASANVKLFNIVRKTLEIEGAARLIQGHLIIASEQKGINAHPFLGRENEILLLESQLTDHRRPASKALYISGNFGAGRKTIAQKLYENQFPTVGRNFPVISIDQYAGIEELYRKVLSTLRPTMRAQELKTRIQAFQIAASKEKHRLIAQLINSLLTANEAAILIDDGGILAEEGGLTPEINELISNLGSKPYPPAIFISPRMIPSRLRRTDDDISYLSVQSLPLKAAERLVAKLLKDNSVRVDDEQLDGLVKLSDGHPFNIYRMIDEVLHIGVAPFLANPVDFIDWKHRQSSEYLAKIPFRTQQVSILGLLKQIPELDFEALVSALKLDPQTASDDLAQLSNLHIIESSGGTFRISPPLRIAVERDKRLRLASTEQLAAIAHLARSLSLRLEEGTAPLNLVDAAVLSSIESGSEISDLAAAFLLPSHYIWLAKRSYDHGQWQESIKFAQEGLKGADRLSSEGKVAACRILCLAAARLWEPALFEVGIKKLENWANNDWAKSNIAFLKGFNSRMRGNLPTAEKFFRESYRLAPGNSSAVRELAAVYLALDNLDEAETFARAAQSYAPTNPYFLDILISVLVRKHGRSSKHVSEINELFDTLERVGEEKGHSFFTTRRAEFEHLWGNNKEALKLINQAISKTPHIFEPRRLHAEILLKEGNKAAAREALDVMRGIVNARDPEERRTSYRQYLKTYSNYYVAIEQWDDAKAIFDDEAIFTPEERRIAIRDIEITQGYKKHR